MSFFEALMLICFGVSWPVSIVKSLKTKVVKGKSPMFMGIIAAGYVSGTLHKLLFSYDWIVILYIVNFFLVSIDLALYFRFNRLENQGQ